MWQSFLLPIDIHHFIEKDISCKFFTQQTQQQLAAATDKPLQMINAYPLN
jgi:hypothetical protein